MLLSVGKQQLQKDQNQKPKIKNQKGLFLATSATSLWTVLAPLVWALLLLLFLLWNPVNGMEKGHCHWPCFFFISLFFLGLFFREILCFCFICVGIINVFPPATGKKWNLWKFVFSLPAFFYRFPLIRRPQISYIKIIIGFKNKEGLNAFIFNVSIISLFLKILITQIL